MPFGHPSKAIKSTVGYKSLNLYPSARHVKGRHKFRTHQHRDSKARSWRESGCKQGQKMFKDQTLGRSSHFRPPLTNQPNAQGTLSNILAKEAKEETYQDRRD